MSIKENILYGNSEASDIRVRQVAEMANAIQFIEQNLEELDRDQLKAQIEKNFTDIVETLKGEYPTCSQLHDLYRKERLNLEDIKLLTEMLEKADSSLMKKVSSRVEVLE